MTVSATLRLLLVMILSAACFPFITLGLDQTPRLAFAATRAALVPVFGLAVGTALFNERLVWLQLVGIVPCWVGLHSSNVMRDCRLVGRNGGQPWQTPVSLQLSKVTASATRLQFSLDARQREARYRSSRGALKSTPGERRRAAV